jgi:SAV_6107-like HEPN
MTVTTERTTARGEPRRGKRIGGSAGAPVPIPPVAAGPPRIPAPTSRAALGLLRQAGDGLAEAHGEADPLLRYPAAYLAALRAAAAVLAVRARPRPRRGAPRDVWHLVAEVAPELGEWAAFFASCSDTRAAAEAGIARLVGRRDADDLLRQAEQFVGIVRGIVPVR